MHFDVPINHVPSYGHVSRHLFGVNITSPEETVNETLKNLTANDANDIIQDVLQSNASNCSNTTLPPIPRPKKTLPGFIPISSIRNENQTLQASNNSNDSSLKAPLEYAAYLTQKVDALNKVLRDKTNVQNKQ